MLNPKYFAEFLIERANKKDGYIMCAVGQDPKKLNDWYYTGQYSGKQLERALHWKDHAERVWDCQGLADGYVSEMTNNYVNVRARNNYADWCSIKGSGKIPAQYRTPGAAVFIHDGNAITHVGYLVEPVDKSNTAGDWWVVEARGVMYGVVKTKLLSRSWNRWGLMTKYFYYNDLEYSDNQNSDMIHERVLHIGYSGADVTNLQRDLISLGYSCGKYGADGEFGYSTKAAVIAFQHDHNLEEDGVVGTDTFAMIDKIIKDDGDPDIQDDTKLSDVEITKGTWYVRTSPSANSSKLGIVHGGEKYRHGTGANEYWVNIIFNGESAWVGKKAVMI